jgi:hypothetical protein
MVYLNLPRGPNEPGVKERSKQHWSRSRTSLSRSLYRSSTTHGWCDIFESSSLFSFSSLFCDQSNEDHCSSCRTVASGGGLVYCDSCPRAFHLMCLNPPANSDDVSDGDWFCPCCIMTKVRYCPTSASFRSHRDTGTADSTATWPVRSTHAALGLDASSRVSVTGRR